MSSFTLTPSERSAKDTQIKCLIERNDELKAEVDYWKDLLELRAKQKTIDALKIKYRIPPAQAAVLGALIRRYPQREPLTPEDLEYVVPARDHASDRNLKNHLAIHMTRLKHRFEPYYFEHIRSVGYLLTESGYKELAIRD